MICALFGLLPNYFNTYNALLAPNKDHLCDAGRAAIATLISLRDLLYCRP